MGIQIHTLSSGSTVGPSESEKMLTAECCCIHKLQGLLPCSNQSSRPPPSSLAPALFYSNHSTVISYPRDFFLLLLVSRPGDLLYIKLLSFRIFSFFIPLSVPSSSGLLFRASPGIRYLFQFSKWFLLLGILPKPF